MSATAVSRGRRPAPRPLPRRSGTLALLAVVLLSAAAHAQLTPEHVVALSQVTTAVLSPDGRLVAYTVSRPRTADDPVGRNFSELRLAAASGADDRAIVERPLSASAPAWSPDGSRLAFVARFEEQHALAQVYAVPPAGGPPARLTDSPTGVAAFAWSPDGTRIAYTAVELEDPERAERRRRGLDMIVAGEGERHVRLWVVSSGAADRRALTPADMTVRDFVWRPDGRGLAIQTTETTDADADLMFRRLMWASVEGGAPTVLVPTEGKLGPMAWSPDGRHIAWLGATALNDPIAQSVFVADRDGGAPRNLTPGYEATAVWLDWQDARTVRFVAVEGTRTSLNRVPAAGGAIERILGLGPEVFQTASFDARGASFATVANAAAHPNEVYIGSLRPAALRRITRLNPALDDLRLARQETVEWDDGRGGRIEGVLTYPLDHQPGARYPLAILPHGGPEGISFDGWTTRALYPAQVLATNGYAVLEPNYRASGGRGVAFSMADHRDLGGTEFDDVIRGIDHLAGLGLVDPDRVGISGTSYGGYFAAWAATRHTDRFRAAITFAGISNWISFTGTTDIPYEMSLVHWDLWWWDSPGLAWDRSPLAWINQARTPTLVATGTADERVHPAQALELYTALRIKGIPTGLVQYPREPHGLLERAHQLDFMQRVLDWFDRYLKDARPRT